MPPIKHDEHKQKAPRQPFTFPNMANNATPPLSSAASAAPSRAEFLERYFINALRSGAEKPTFNEAP